MSNEKDFIVVKKGELAQLFNDLQRKGMIPPKKWITRHEAAAIAGVSVRTIDKRTREGIYTVSKGKGLRDRLYILHRDVEQLLDRNSHVKGSPESNYMTLGDIRAKMKRSSSL